MTHRHIAEVIIEKLTDEELEALTEMLKDKHQLLLHALDTYSKPKPAVSRTTTPRKVG